MTLFLENLLKFHPHFLDPIFLDQLFGAAKNRGPTMLKSGVILPRRFWVFDGFPAVRGFWNSASGFSNHFFSVFATLKKTFFGRFSRFFSFFRLFSPPWKKSQEHLSPQNHTLNCILVKLTIRGVSKRGQNPGKFNIGGPKKWPFWARGQKPNFWVPTEIWRDWTLQISKLHFGSKIVRISHFHPFFWLFFKTHFWALCEFICVNVGVLPKTSEKGWKKLKNGPKTRKIGFFCLFSATVLLGHVI